MKPLNPDYPAWFLFPWQEAMFDRTQITLTANGHCPDVDAFHRIIHHLGSWVEGTPDRHALFRMDQGRSQAEYRIHIRDGWLFTLPNFRSAGKTYFDHRNRRVSFHLTLAVNPTRFLAYQTMSQLDDIEQLPPDTSLWKGGRSLQLHSLDNQDNMLGLAGLGGRSFDRRAHHWEHASQIYFQHIEALFTDRLGELHTDDFEFIGSPRLEAVQQAEVYWELETPSALDGVARLRNAIQAIAPSHRSTCVYTTGLEWDAPFVTLHLTKEIRLQIYAKDFQRIRFEVKYDAPIRQIARRSSATSEGPLGDLQAVRHDAAHRLAKVWPEIARFLSCNIECGDPFAFTEHLRRACGDNAGKIFSILASNRGIMEGQLNHVEMRQLVRQRILLPKASICYGGPKRFPLALEWSNMFDMLTGRTDSPNSTMPHCQAQH